MKRLFLLLTLSVALMLPCVCSAQYNCNPFCLIGGGTGGTIGMWSGSGQTRQMTNSPITISSGPQVVVSSAPIDVEGSNPVYEILASTVLSIGSASDANLFAGVFAGTDDEPGNGGVQNTFVGYGAGQTNTTGQLNTFIGEAAGNSNSSNSLGGNHNVFVGNHAGFDNTTGNDNTFTGTDSGYNSNAGSDDTFYGYQAGYNNEGGANNTFLGYRAGYNNTTGVNNIYIGPEGPAGGENNTIRIGTSAQAAAYIQGISGVTVSGGTEVYINTSGQLGTTTSSLRFKEQVRDMGDSTNDLMKLRPVTFFYKPEYANGEHTLQYGLIAEEVAKVYPELVAYDKDRKPYAVRYQYIATMLLNEVQKQYQHAEAQAELVKAQQQEIDGLKQQLQVQNATLQVQNAALQERLSRLEAVARVETAAAH